MKTLDHNASYEQVRDAARHFWLAKPSDFKYAEGQDGHSRTVTLYKDTDPPLCTKSFYSLPFDVECVGENNEFIDRLNSYIIAEYHKPHAIDWNRRFLAMACGEINTWSKDPSTKVSATIFRGKYPIASSYNGFPPGIADTAERLHNRELKYKFVQHAEANAIATCAKLGIATDGCTMAISHYPCTSCAGKMLSAGIAKVIVRKPTADFLSRWKDDIEFAQAMFKEAGVELIEIDLDDGT